MKVICPKDGGIMHPVDLDRHSYECLHCHYSWSQTKTIKNQNNQISSLSTFISFVFILTLSSIFLITVQMGGLSSYADSQVVEKSVKLSALLVWWVVFMLLFSLPVSIYYQMAIRKKSISNTIKSPWNISVPFVVLILELLNVLLIFPIIKL
mgnify:FL=1